VLHLIAFDDDAIGAVRGRNGRAIGTANGGNHARSGVPGDVQRRLAQCRRGPTNDDRLAALQAQVVVQASPRGRIRLGQRCQVGPVEPRTHRHDVVRRHRHTLGVAAVSRAAHAAHERHHGLPAGERAARIVDDLADALDAGDGGHFSPEAEPEVLLRAVDAERLHAHEHFAAGCRRIGTVRICSCSGPPYCCRTMAFIR